MRDSGDAGIQVLPWMLGSGVPTEEPAVDRWCEFQHVYHECLPAVLRYMLARVGDPVVAEDLTADVFEQAARSWASFERRSSPRTWVLGIAHHVLSHHWRQRRAQVVPLESAIVVLTGPQRSDPEQVAEARHDAEMLERAIALLPARDQELLQLRYAADLSLREIASVLGIRAVTARVQMHRAMRRLRSLLLEMEG
jgi:RNA polymerase sigma-70 factor (ECF subfamily)